MSTSPRRAAFTLVELLVVIGIIALLIGILLPTLTRAREHAQKVKCASNLRSVTQATLMYAADNKGFVPVRYRKIGTVYKTTSTFGPASGFVPGNPPTPSYANGPALLVKNGAQGNGANYLENNDVFFCPTDLYRAPYRNNVTGWGPTSIQDVAANQTSMSFWWWYFPEKYWPASGVESTAPEAMQNHKASVRNAAQKMYITDQFIPVPPAATSVTDIYKNFHKDGMNVGYLDGHVTWVASSAFDQYVRATGETVYSTVIINASNQNY